MGEASRDLAQGTIEAGPTACSCWLQGCFVRRPFKQDQNLFLSGCSACYRKLGLVRKQIWLAGALQVMVSEVVCAKERMEAREVRHGPPMMCQIMHE